MFSCSQFDQKKMIVLQIILRNEIKGKENWIGVMRLYCVIYIYIYMYNKCKCFLTACYYRRETRLTPSCIIIIIIII